MIDSLKPIIIDPRFPITNMRWARGYVFMVTFLEDLGVKSVSTHPCEQELGDADYLFLYLDAHYKQVKSDAKDYIDREIEQGYIIDELLIKKYLK